MKSFKLWSIIILIGLLTGTYAWTQEERKNKPHITIRVTKVTTRKNCNADHKFAAAVHVIDYKRPNKRFEVNVEPPYDTQPWAEIFKEAMDFPNADTQPLRAEVELNVHGSPGQWPKRETAEFKIPNSITNSLLNQTTSATFNFQFAELPKSVTVKFDYDIILSK